MNIKSSIDFFNRNKDSLFLSVITIIFIPIIIDPSLHFIKALILNYISAFVLLMLISFVLFVAKEKKIITIVWIIFIIFVTANSIYLYLKKENVKVPEINFYGLYENDKQGLIKTTNDELMDKSILKGINDTDVFKITNKYLPNHILYFLDKEEIFKNYEMKNNILSVLIYKEDNIYKIVNLLQENSLNSPYHTKKHLELIKNTFNEILNLNSVNKEDVIRDLLIIYQQNFIRNSSAFLLNKIYDFKTAYDKYNISVNSIYSILHKYKRLVSDNNIISKINFLLNIEQSNSKYILASMNMSNNDYNSAIKNLIACMQLSPYYPYDNYEEFLKDFEAYYHVIQINSYDYLKSAQEFSDIFLNVDENHIFQKNIYTTKLSSNYLEIVPPFFIIKDILVRTDLNDEIYILIENKFNELLHRNSIFKFYFADIVKFLPKGKEKLNDIYFDRLDESKMLLEDFMKLDNNFDNVIFQKLIAIYMFKQSYEKKDYSKEIQELFNKIGDDRLINGPTP
ncbi:hypothetical protein PJV94_07875 [Aliarcobacter butzleri]|uniref:hypothetical protein n=1 Tax=Aliarcobacter butzleri TaxID=28197 RepID=UPI00263E43E9|nr:hypothetical protein [Aliarcobacter butzleri]MDN5072349.1 hypothetical protein [Aliarcobacter butzleri]MDN5121585.1 hypothetical protein [Aliarcobacter butzleri]MDN5129969.1 hypothetical protein [Aliarcobacter butzleri]